jgi:hypothetical protein
MEYRTLAARCWFELVQQRLQRLEQRVPSAPAQDCQMHLEQRFQMVRGLELELGQLDREQAEQH